MPGYSTLWEYAADQFGLSMSSASRYITINDRFSVGGNTPMLMEEYRNFSKSRLQEMISLLAGAGEEGNREDYGKTDPGDETQERKAEGSTGDGD